MIFCGYYSFAKNNFYISGRIETNTEKYHIKRGKTDAYKKAFVYHCGMNTSMACVFVCVFITIHYVFLYATARAREWTRNIRNKCVCV